MDGNRVVTEAFLHQQMLDLIEEAIKSLNHYLDVVDPLLVIKLEVVNNRVVIQEK